MRKTRTGEGRVLGRQEAERKKVQPTQCVGHQASADQQAAGEGGGGGGGGCNQHSMVYWSLNQPTQHGLLVTQSTNTAWSIGHSINQHSMVYWSLNHLTQHGPWSLGHSIT